MDSPFVGRIIGVILSFPQISQYENKLKGNTTIFLASVYHLVEEVKNTDFIDILICIMSSVPKTANFIGGNDINANLGNRSKMYRKTLGPWGLDNRNMKGRTFLGFFSHNQLKIANSLFKKPSFETWRYFSKMSSPHMLDVISVSENFLKCVRSCGVYKKGMRTDHSAVRLDFMNLSNKYKNTFIKKPIIYSKAIKEREDVNKKFNVNLRNRLREPFNYTEINEAILRCGKETSMTNNSENQG